MVDKLPVDFITQAPLIPKERVLELLKDNFGIKSAEINSLSGYDDLNFLLEDVVYEKEENAEKYGRKLVIKFTNPIEARYPDLLDSQVRLMTHLNANGIPCPQTIPTISNKNYAYVKMTQTVCLPLRCFTFLPGQTMDKVGYSNQLYVKIGQLTAKFHNLTSDYADTQWFRKNHIPIVVESWEYLENEFLIQQKMGTIKNVEICQEIFRKFRIEVLEKRHQFEEGIIHSDLNETNVLLERHGNDYEVTGLLDFGDTHFSLRIFDIATAILYILLDFKTENPAKDWPPIISQFLNGYKSQRSIKDLVVCQLSMCARLVASLLYGLRTVRLNARGDDPSYILKTQNKGWEYLKILFDKDLNLFSDFDNQ